MTDRPHLIVKAKTSKAASYLYAALDSFPDDVAGDFKLGCHDCSRVQVLEQAIKRIEEAKKKYQVSMDNDFDFEAATNDYIELMAAIADAARVVEKKG